MLNDLFPSLGPTTEQVGAVGFALVLIWSLVWKGLALWKAARRGDKTWYVLLLVINTIGLLEIIYYFLVAKKKENLQAQN